MTKQEYLHELTQHIRKLPAQEVKDILADYEEHFLAGRQAGKTEGQIVDGLGTPKAVAQEILVNNLMDRAENSNTIGQKSAVLLRMLVAFMILAPLNFFMFLGPFLLLACLLIGGWALPIAGLAVGIGLIAMVMYGFGSLAWLTGFSLLFMFTGTLGTVVMIMVIMLLLTKGVLSLLVSYLKWNINFITARKV